MFEIYADELCRKCAAKYVNRSEKTFASYDSNKRYDFKPFKKEDRKVYYYRSVLDQYAEKDLIPPK